MTEQLIVPTPFADLAELTQNFAQRVEETRVVLPYSAAFEEGTVVDFEIQLADATSGFAGRGRVEACYDNGEFDENGDERPPEYRYDVVLEELVLEGMNEVVFERLLMERQSQESGASGTGEVDLNSLDANAMSEPPMEADWAEEAEPASAELDMDDLDAPAPLEAQQVVAPVAQVAAEKPAAAKKAQPQAKPGELPAIHSFESGPLSRDSVRPAWVPESDARPDAAQSSGVFEYPNGLPRPAKPPRPDIDESRRVHAAPRPGAPAPRA